MTTAPSRPRLAQLRPRQVVTATRLMYGGVLLALVGVLVNALSRDEITRVLERANASRSPGGRLSATDLRHAAGLTYTAFLVMSVAAVVVWLVMAVTNARGQGWARIVATVLAVMNLLLTIGMATRGTAAATIAEAPTVLLGAAVAWLLWQPASTRFFEQCAMLRTTRRADRAVAGQGEPDR